ncbi:PLP-dependent aminotransferase family protein [Geosporobacter ferrireducens]|uniref:DegT/DnrJ/EryC1/StrS aminotransferase family protein n=1 Tax=Geosporobacter ferrireducens TaxID=1424294 RepID=A0A1D8GGU5_9FIRM|nr:hypothetical protein [Geosporobacter ferrireducens]AOT70135.1 hypothetical protein Gferi_11355 [Geosporobacter ferrireducens]
MIINKTASEKENYKLCDYYYDSAREGMYDLLLNMTNDGLIKTVFVPGYVGWSPREGSGIFDPINKIENVSIVYYRMDNNLNIDLNNLYEKIDSLDNDKFAILIVNYFGFVDPNIEEICSRIKEKNGWIIEDNAHGFFTSLYLNHSCADATFFSLHKMFPFNKGGSIKVLNDSLKKYSFEGKNINQIVDNPWSYDISKIALKRKSNYEKIDKLVRLEKYCSIFEPLKGKLDDGIIPQTYPIKIQVGNRDKIYELMNQSGYGVVSLYHTLIEPLRNTEHSDALKLSKQILNLPVHQDVNSNEYENMVDLLAKFCLETV